MAKKEESFKASEIGIPSQNIELDPRSVTTANGMPRNYIPTGDKTEVRGTKIMANNRFNNYVYICSIRTL